MRVTATLTEKEIIEIIRQHFSNDGKDVYDYQIYEETGKISVDIRYDAEIPKRKE